MDAVLQRFNLDILRSVFRSSVMPIGILILVAMMVVPLPSILLDIFFVTNILV
jgi:flagellar biosynthesis protein FlhA